MEQEQEQKEDARKERSAIFVFFGVVAFGMVVWTAISDRSLRFAAAAVIVAALILIEVRSFRRASRNDTQP